MRVSGYIPHWRQEEERPAAPKEAAAPSERPAPAPDPVPAPEPERAAPASETVVPAQQFDYGLLSPALDGFGEPEDGPGQDAPYGAFDLIETLPQDVGGNHNEEGQR